MSVQHVSNFLILRSNRITEGFSILVKFSVLTLKLIVWLGLFFSTPSGNSELLASLNPHLITWVCVFVIVCVFSLEKSSQNFNHGL